MGSGPFLLDPALPWPMHGFSTLPFFWNWHVVFLVLHWGLNSFPLLSSFFCLVKITQYHIFPFHVVQVERIWTNQFQQCFFLIMVGSVLLLIIYVSNKWSTMTSKSTVLSKWEKCAMFIANPHSSSSVIE